MKPETFEQTLNEFIDWIDLQREKQNLEMCLQIYRDPGPLRTSYIGAYWDTCMAIKNHRVTED